MRIEPRAGSPADGSSADESRVLLLPPTSRDAQAINRLLTEAGIDCRVCTSVTDLCEQIHIGCGVVLMSEEAVTAEPERLVACVAAQHVWSDLSTIVLSRSGPESPTLTAVLPKLGNVTVLERPMRMTTMLSLIRSGLRGRQRQYQVRDYLVERERTEQNLRVSDERLRLAVQTGKLGVWELNLQTREIACSAGCRANYGRGPDEPFTYDDLLQSIHPDDVDRVRAAVQQTIDRHADYDTEYRTAWPDGSLHWILVRGRLALVDAGAPQRLVGVTLDITDRKAAEEQRAALLEAERSARAEAERAGRMKDEFLATLSHELRTPLNAILGWSQILNAGPNEPAAATEGLHAIERNARAQTQIIEDLLDMNRIISGKVRLDVRRIDLPAVVGAAVETVRPAAAAKNVRLRLRTDRPAGVVNGDPNRLQQVLWNLLSNAVKFTPAGQQITVTVTWEKERVEIGVIDTGEGISPDFLPHVFDRFRQADASMSRRHGGLGLGLAIVKQLVELHGGTIRADSPGVGRGATFVVSLPLATAEPDRPGPRRPRELAPCASTADDIAGVRVLVVDDESDARGLMKRMLENCGAVVLTAESAAAGMRIVQVERPEILISDIGMPGEDGYAFIRRIRGLSPEAGGRVPAIALTAYARTEDRANAMRAGYQLHLTKPVEATELIAVIAGLIRSATNSPPTRTPGVTQKW